MSKLWVEMSTSDVILKALLEHMWSKMVLKAVTSLKPSLLDIFVDPNFCPEKLVLPGGEMYSLSSAIRGLFTNYDI